MLPEKDQNTIIKITGRDFSKEKFQLQILHFFGEGENKFDTIKKKIEEFLRKAINDVSYSKLVLDCWFETFMINCSDKPNNQKKLTLKKEQIIYPVIAVVLNNNTIIEEEFKKVCSNDDYFDVIKEYRKIINDNLCDYEFVIEVIGDYCEKQEQNCYAKLSKYDYTTKCWNNFETKFSKITHPKKRESLVKLLILSIISQRSLIDDIKEASNL